MTSDVIHVAEIGTGAAAERMNAHDNIACN
jgi:hypothetical protein